MSKSEEDRRMEKARIGYQTAMGLGKGKKGIQLFGGIPLKSSKFKRFFYDSLTDPEMPPKKGEEEIYRKTL